MDRSGCSERESTRTSREVIDVAPGRPIAPSIAVALLTGGIDLHYAFGLALALVSQGSYLDIIGSDELVCPAFFGKKEISYRNLRGSQRQDVTLVQKVFRVGRYYAKLIRYAASAKPKIFHILWNNRLESFDRTALMLYYKLLGKRIVLTAHNVNAGQRDSNDTLINRLTLRIQYRLADHIFVHTERMKRELVEEFHVSKNRVTVIPYGINNSVPNTQLTTKEAKARLGIREGERTILFFGRITPYKGLEHLIEAFRQLRIRHDEYRLIIAGKPDRCDEYWNTIRGGIRDEVEKGHVLLQADFIPDDETEVYFKAADVFVLPYRAIFQSGVLFLGYSFGLPVLASDVGSLRDDIVEGKTGFVFRPEDPVDLARAAEDYFASDLYTDLDRRRPDLLHHMTERHSWDVVGQLTKRVYAALLDITLPEELSRCAGSTPSPDRHSDSCDHSGVRP